MRASRAVLQLRSERAGGREEDDCMLGLELHAAATRLAGGGLV